MNYKNLINLKPQNRWLYLVKLLISVVAIVIAIKMVDDMNVKSLLINTDIVLFLVGLFLYVVAQFVSSERLRLFVNRLKTGHIIKSKWNNKLYFIGMAYNLFLPGGIGGDAYKVIAYGKRLNISKGRVLIALIIDRFSGLMAIAVCLAILPYLQILPFDNWFGLFWPIPVILVLMITQSIISKKYKRYKSIYALAVAISMFVQLLQVGSFLVLAHSVGIVDHDISLTAVFLLSSIATVIPVFLGGLGAREIVFASMAVVFGYNQGNAVSAALLFSFIVVIASLPGLLLSLTKSSSKKK